PNIHQKGLKLSARVEMDKVAKKFYKHSKNIQEMGFDQGIPGKVWKSKTSILWNESDIIQLFIRNNAAKKSGVKSVLGIPLIHQEKTVGIMVMGTNEDIGKMERSQSILTNMELHIGSEINRKRLESDLHHLFDTLPDLICIVDLNGQILKINQAGCEHLGYEEHEVIGQSFDDFTHPMDKIVLNKKIKKIKKGATNFNFEIRFITKNNDILWFSWNLKSIKEEGIIYATAKNITEEKKLRELVEDASQLARIGGWEIDLVTNTIYWSKMIHELYETDPESFTPTPSSL